MTPKRDPKEDQYAFRPLDISLTITYPSGNHPIKFIVRRDQHPTETTKACLMTNEITHLPPGPATIQYILAICDFAKHTGCEFISLPKEIVLQLPRI